MPYPDHHLRISTLSNPHPPINVDSILQNTPNVPANRIPNKLLQGIMR